MSTDTDHGLSQTLEAAADLSAAQYYFVKIDSNGRAALAGRGDLAVGVLQNKPAALKRAATICMFSGEFTKVVYGGSVTAGQSLVSDANGKAVNASSADNNYLGIALVSGSSGDVGAMVWQPRGLS